MSVLPAGQYSCLGTRRTALDGPDNEARTIQVKTKSRSVNFRPSETCTDRIVPQNSMDHI